MSTKAEVLATKAQLRELAEAGAPAPPRQLKPLGKALHNYTAPASEAYDPLLSLYLREMRPDWFKAGGVRKRNHCAFLVWQQERVPCAQT